MTGFPWIDAIMRQLRSDGWIHDVARRAVGSFLTRGCLWINWEEGFKVERLTVILLTVGNCFLTPLRLSRARFQRRLTYKICKI